MGSAESLESDIITSSSLDVDSLNSICSGWDLTNSSPSAEVELNEENLQQEKENAKQPKKSAGTSSQVGVLEENERDKENMNSNTTIQLGEKQGTEAPSGSKEASPSECEKKVISGESKKKDGESIRFKRKLSCVSSSQPVSKKDLKSPKATNWFFEYKKQVQVAKKMRLEAERSIEKLNMVRSQIKIISDILMK